MSYFIIKIEAIDLLVKTDKSKVETWGCFCTRYIQDNSIDSAILKAIALVQSELGDEGILCVEKQIFIESAKEINEIPENVAGKGFTFYPINETSQH